MLLLRAQNTSYTPTQDDRLWLLRAVAAEGEPQNEVAATLVNGFMWARSKAGWTKPLAAWVRAYAQPVNPRWFADGDLHKAALAKAPNERVALEAKAAARELVHSKRTRFGERTVQAVDAALTRPPRLPDATDYAASWFERKPPWVPVTPIVPRENRFWTRPQARGWAGYLVGPADGNGPPVGPVIALLACLALYLASRA